MKDLLLLVDIDGTILSTNGVAINCMIEAAQEECQKKIQFETKDYIGQLDPQIIETLLKKGGYSPEEIDKRKNIVYENYITTLKPSLKKEDITIYKGVFEFLDYISTKNLNFGLLTGNTQEGAKTKLAAVNLFHMFSFGAYGGDAQNRNDLVPIAIYNAEKKYETKFKKNNIWVIGDSPNDILCAKNNDIKCCIVTTGRSKPEELSKMQPDLLVDYLTQPEQLLGEFVRISQKV